VTLESRLRLAMPTGAGLVPAVVTVVEKVRLSRGVSRDPLIRALYGWQKQMLVAFRGRGAEWLGIRFLMLEIRGRVSAGYTSGMPNLFRVSITADRFRDDAHTLRSSHAVNFLTPSPASLKPSLASSNKSCTLSLTRSVSRLVPSRFNCCDRRPIFEVRAKSFSERLSLKRLNSGSSRYSGSSCLRYVVG